MWRIRANKTIKREELLEANLEAMCKVVLSICDPVLKDQVCNHEYYEDMNNKQDTLGYYGVKVKTTCTKQKHLEINIQNIPQEIMEKHGYVTLAIDLMFINKIPFVMTTSCNIHFGTAKPVKDMKNKTLVTSIQQVI